eukprot:TRINITY_DN5300_c0_g1_i1.p1 TRINITY_DN5300_c0_g1~~TRINITY_DN5300_c0_g1_i1.p1  ORF type:complete len:61 (+),score=15.96 TRINITY_DN5300_c0_g1_i1:321-503(+)
MVPLYNTQYILKTTSVQHFSSTSGRCLTFIQLKKNYYQKKKKVTELDVDRSSETAKAHRG